MEDLKEPQVIQRQQLADAEDATAKEHDMTFMQAVKLYPKAVLWSMMMSTSLVMDGFDFKLVGSLFAQPAFRKAYGKVQPNGSYQIPAPWQSGLNNGSNVGQLLGLLLGGSFTEALGFRKTMMMALVAVPCIIFIQFFAPSLAVLEVGQILLGRNIRSCACEKTDCADTPPGIPLGMFQTVVCVYAVELMPTRLRAHLTSYASVCWVSHHGLIP